MVVLSLRANPASLGGTKKIIQLGVRDLRWVNHGFLSLLSFPHTYSFFTLLLPNHPQNHIEPHVRYRRVKHAGKHDDESPKILVYFREPCVRTLVSRLMQTDTKLGKTIHTQTAFALTLRAYGTHQPNTG